MVKTVGKYDLYKTLGMGAFGKVKFAVNRETQEPVAIKILDKAKIQVHNMTNQIKREISIMKMVHHKHVIAVKDVFATVTKIFIVLELVEGGELFDKVVAAGKFNEEQARFYFRQIIEGLEHCHSIGVCHRDLKPENLLLDAEGNIKISDFGLATLYIGDSSSEGSAQRTELLHTTCGTPNYVAPEVLASHGYDGMMADVWSIGVILFVLIAGYLPFEEKTMAALFSKIKAADFVYPSSFPPMLRSLLDGILVVDPKQRLTLSQVKTHPWVTEPLVETPQGLKIMQVYPSVEGVSGSEKAERQREKNEITNLKSVEVTVMDQDRDNSSGSSRYSSGPESPKQRTNASPFLGGYQPPSDFNQMEAENDRNSNSNLSPTPTNTPVGSGSSGIPSNNITTNMNNAVSGNTNESNSSNNPTNNTNSSSPFSFFSSSSSSKSSRHSSSSTMASTQQSTPARSLFFCICNPFSAFQGSSPNAEDGRDEDDSASVGQTWEDVESNPASPTNLSMGLAK